MFVCLAQLVKSLASSCVLAHAYPNKRTPEHTRPSKPSILSGSVKLVAVGIQWVVVKEDCMFLVQRGVKCVCMALWEVIVMCNVCDDNQVKQ
jgi:hypothetical protein